MSDNYCPACSGSGEGLHESTRCHSCGGSGVERDYDAEYERKCEAADHYNDMRKDAILERDG